MARVLVLGGYGNAGSQIVEMLMAVGDADVVVAGRHRDRADQLVRSLNDRHPGLGARLSTLGLDAGDRQALLKALVGVDLLIVASATGPTAVETARACLATGTDYLDIQLGSAKVAGIRSLNAEALHAGVALVTDGGFHPGMPAAMVRYLQQRVPFLTTALVGSVIAGDWRALQPLAESTVDEMMAEFRDYRYEEYREGCWVSARRSRSFTFPGPFGARKCAAMGLAEMHELTVALPRLQSAGFYVGGFNPVVDRLIIPVAWLGMKVAPRLTMRPIGRWMYRALIRYSKPPYATILQVDGAQTGQRPRPMMRVGHADGYTMTAAPTVAAALQLLDPATRRSGVHLQAMFVEPERFFTDLQRLGVTVELLGLPAPA